METLFENEDLILVNKPSGILSQRDLSGNKNMQDEISRNIGCDCYVLHRLDYLVGGVMVYAKNKRAAAQVSAVISDHEKFVKHYFAVVNGIFEEKNGFLEDFLYHDVRKSKVFVVKRERRGVKKALLYYDVLAEKDGQSLLLVRLHTGRTHQIRVQLASRKHPVIGDGKYGDKHNCDIALFSCSLSFPYGNKTLKVFCLPPKKYPFDAFSQELNEEFLKKYDFLP